MKLFNTIAASVAVAVATAGVAHADVNSQLASLQAQVNQLQAQVNNGGSSSMAGTVGVNPALSWAMMGNMPGVGKELTLLKARQNGLNTPVTIGGYAQGDIIYQHTNTKGAFNVAPIQNGASIFGGAGNESNASRFQMSNANLAVTAAMGQWLTGYIQTGAQNIGDASANGSNGDNLSVQDAYAVFGNLAKNPVYAFGGKKDVDFGSFQTVDMYTAPLTRDAFQASGDTAGVGVNAYGFNGTLSLMNGGANGTGMSTSSSSNFGKNYAVNLGYGMMTSGVNWNVGAGYLRGSQFSNSSGNTNAAWDLNGKLSVAGFDFMAEYDMTAQDTNLGDANKKASAWNVGADYNFPVMGFNSAVSAEYSQANLASGSDNTLKQFVLGYRIQPVNNVWTGLEYAYNKNGAFSASASDAGAFYGSGYNSSTVLWDVTAAF